jgi:hypothetical protein
MANQNIDIQANLPSGRHTGAGRYPAIKNRPRSGQSHEVALRRNIFNNWIPACAGMTI